MIGSTLSHYRITSLLGEGGMGTVYRAEDTHLHRDVAIKVLPEGLTADPERLARFEREAQVLASLNHPHIGAIYGLEQDEGSHFLILELIEGDTLQERLARGALPLEDALGHALQIATGLEAAHEQGIIHRDLKPANIKITPDGTVKLLDFGLAKASDPMAASDVDLSQSPTMTAGMTQAGMILGTAAYMSPEQARGYAVDKRADIWAFGVVLHEMLTGASLFAGESLTDLLAAVVRAEIDLEALPSDVPSTIKRLMARCLDRDTGRRLRDIGEARIVVADFLADPDVDRQAPEAPVASSPLWRRALPWTLAPLAVIAAWSLRPAPPEEPLPLLRFDLRLPEGRVLTNWTRHALAVSPDGTQIVFVGGVAEEYEWQLYLRDLSQEEARPIPGTEYGLQPLFSPDGKWLSFIAVEGFESRLMKISLDGGEPIQLCDCAASLGASWGPDDTIVFANVDGPLQTIPAGGGEPTDLTSLEETGDNRHRLPQYLPGGKAVLFTRMKSHFDWSRSGISVFSLETGEYKALIDVGSDASYLPTGHIVFARKGKLIAVPFDADRLEVTGPEVLLIDGIHHSIYGPHSSFDTGAAQLAVSDSGLLVYAPGSTLPEGGNTVAIVDREGKEEPLDLEPREYLGLRVSDDNRALLINYAHPPMDIWLYDLERGLMRRQTFEGEHDAGWATWGPGADHFSFASKRAGPVSALSKRVDSGPGEVEPLLPEQQNTQPVSWTRDGEHLAFLTGEDSYDIWIFSRAGGARPYLDTRFEEQFPEFSPDGRWMLYTSNESGQRQVYVVGFPEKGAAVQISVDHGTSPAWSRDGREIFFKDQGQLWSVAVRVEDGRLRPGEPVLVMPFPYGGSAPIRDWDPMPDGRFAVVGRQDEELAEANQKLMDPDRLRVVQNWFDEVRERVPVER